MYRTRPWTFRQLAGFATAADTNKRYRMLLDRGATGINGVFDYPSLRAVGSDDPRAASDVGRGGVAVDVADDFDDLFAGIPLDSVSVSLVSSQPVGAAPHLAMFLAAAERRGFERAALAGTSQNDFLMETAITIAPEALPPAASFRVECDVAEFCIRELPRWNPISVTGYNYREAGADAPLELALTLAHGRAAARELLGRGLAPEAALPKISFFLDAHADFFEEIAKFRAARRMWAHFVRDDARRDRPGGAEVPLPRPDRRGDGHGPAAPPQHRPQRHPGAGGGAGRHAVAPRRRLRRGAVDPQRARRAHRPAHPARPPVGDRRGRQRRPARGQLPRRAPHRRHGGTDRGADRPDRGAGRPGGGHRGGLGPHRAVQAGVRRPAGPGGRAPAGGRHQRRARRRRGPGRAPAASRCSRSSCRQGRWRPSSGESRRCGPDGTERRSAAALEALARGLRRTGST